MEAYAVIEAGGKQYRVQKGDTVTIELVGAEAGAIVELKPVLAVSTGKEVRLGAPELADAVVKAEVIRNVRGPKVVAFKKHRRKGYARALIAELAHIGKQKGWARIYWLADSRNEAAQTLYKTLGIRLDFSLHVLPL